ncbi:MAG: alpha/beta fold hydrolase [Bacteriovoracaceae bacterium]
MNITVYHLSRKIRQAKLMSFVLVILFIIHSNFSLHAQQKITSKNDIVVLLHGLGRGKSIMVPMQEQLNKDGFSVSLVDYSSIGRSPDEILKDVSEQINAFITDTNYTVHFVGHSLGGLLIRAYLDSVKLPNLGKVVLIGSPSKGTPFVDRFHDAWWLKMVGPTAVSLGTDDKSFPRTLLPPYFPVGIIAGISSVINNDDFIPGEDDGIVPVESTKIEGMSDFILVKVSHSSLPKDKLVIQQTIEFLRNGKFLQETPMQQK